MLSGNAVSQQPVGSEMAGSGPLGFFFLADSLRVFHGVTRWGSFDSSDVFLGRNAQVIRHTNVITKRIQEVFRTVQERRQEQLEPCADRIQEAVQSMADMVLVQVSLRIPFCCFFLYFFGLTIVDNGTYGGGGRWVAEREQRRGQGGAAAADGERPAAGARVPRRRRRQPHQRRTGKWRCQWLKKNAFRIQKKSTADPALKYQWPKTT